MASILFSCQVDTWNSHMTLIGWYLGLIALVLLLLSGTIPNASLWAAEMDPPPVAELSRISHIADLVTTAIEAAGMAIIVVGATIATILFLRDGFASGGWAGAYERYRANLGRGILLGLELLVAADIIGTVAAPLDLRSIGALGLIVLIRTFLSFSLEVEIKGHWPWQESRIKKPDTQQPKS
jgi:uncharacterized membrane protein